MLGARLGLLSLLALLGSSCNGDPAESTVISRQTISNTSTAPAAATLVPVPTASPTTAATATDLPGEPFTSPTGGTNLTVVGVAAGSSLNLRELPGVDHAVRTTVRPGAGLVATGRARLLSGGSGGVWTEVSNGATTGWASTQFLSFPGRTTAGRSQFIELNETFDGPQAVADRIRAGASTGAEGQVDVVIAEGPTATTAGQLLVIDILGFADDSVQGNRLRITGEAGPRDSLVVVGIESMVLCYRGVSPEGLCT